MAGGSRFGCAGSVVPGVCSGRGRRVWARALRPGRGRRVWARALRSGVRHPATDTPPCAGWRTPLAAITDPPSPAHRHRPLPTDHGRPPRARCAPASRRPAPERAVTTRARPGRNVGPAWPPRAVRQETSAGENGRTQAKAAGARGRVAGRSERCGDPATAGFCGRISHTRAEYSHAPSRHA